MQPIHKKILLDENQKPIAVQIDYADWLQIETLLSDNDLKTPSIVDISSFAGILEITEDPLAYQERVRDEWL